MRKRRLFTTAGFVLGLLLIATWGYVQLPVMAQQSNRVGLVVDFGDHHITRCVEFEEAEITGYDVLRRAGLDVVVFGSGGMGFAVCDINNTSGCNASNCFCQCQGSPCIYWSYHHLVDGSWQYSQLGASSYKARNGDVEGWGWGEGTINESGAQPPVIPFDQICAPPATDTPVPTNTPIPATNTPIPPTDTPSPTPVPAPEAWFRIDHNPIAAGSCTILRWDTSSTTKVYLDGAEVETIGSRQVCPVEATDYELRIVGLEDEATYRLTLGVTGSVATVTPTSNPTGVPPSPEATADSGASTPPAASPTSEASTGLLASPTATAPSSPTPGAVSPSKPASASSSATPLWVAQARPTATAIQMAHAEDSEDQTVEEDRATASSEDDSPSPVLPIGYIAFSLIVGGLLGWLIYILKVRGRHA